MLNWGDFLCVRRMCVYMFICMYMCIPVYVDVCGCGCGDQKSATNVFPAPTWQLPPIGYYSSRGSDVPFFWPPKALNSHGSQTYIQAMHTYTQNKIIKNILKKKKNQCGFQACSSVNIGTLQKKRLEERLAHVIH